MEKTKQGIPEAEQAAAAPTPSPAAPATYSAEELIAASGKVFGVSPDIVTAAFRVAGIKRAAVEDAKKIVKDFAHKEVK